MIKIEYIEVDKLILHDKNPRKIDDQQFAILCKSIVDNADYFETRPILCNKNMQVFAGNMRLRAALKVGMKQVPCAIMDISPEKERELMVRDNVQNGNWDSEMLPALFDNSELVEWGVDLKKFGVFDEYKNKEVTDESLGNESIITFKFSSEKYLEILNAMENAKRDLRLEKNEDVLDKLLEQYV